MKKQNMFFVIACVAMSLISGMLSWQRGKKVGESLAISCIDTLYKSDTLYLDRPDPVFIYMPEVPEFVDTFAIIHDYYLAKIYNDTLIHTPELTAVVRDTVYKNMLQGRAFYFDYSSPVLKQPVRNNSFYLAADTRLSTSLIFTHKSLLFQGGYDFNNKTPFLGLAYKLY